MNKSLIAARYQKAKGVKQGIEAIYDILGAVVWNAANDAGLTDNQAQKMSEALVSEAESMLRMVGKATTAEELMENAEYIVGKANECKKRMDEHDT